MHSALALLVTMGMRNGEESVTVISMSILANCNTAAFSIKSLVIGARLFYEHVGTDTKSRTTSESR